MDKIVVGRDEQKQLLNTILATDNASLVTVYGRRRVGKTYLIRNYLHSNICFDFTGIHNVTTTIQLEKFTENLSEQLNKKKSLTTAQNWFDALSTLQRLLTPLLRKKKQVIFFDEFPWIQTPKSNFLAAFENFWNTWASNQNNLTVVICGSSAGWMIKNVLRNKGGLHNRVTHKIALQPFSLYETEQYLNYKKVYLNHYQIIQLYMAMGGIPHYLQHIQAGLSATQIIEQACFTKTGFLYNEFTNLYQSLFDDANKHISVVKALAQKPSGLTRTQLIKACKLQSGGSTTILLDELSSSGFITPYTPMGKQVKDAIYKLTDEFSLFYIKFMESNRVVGKNIWQKLSDTPSYKSWSGLAFESICLKHVDAIKNTLGIAGIYSENSIWRSKAVIKGNAAQVDLVINRRDNCINLCEIKFYENDFSIDKKYATELRNKKHQFKEQLKTKKHLFITLISTYPLTQNINSIGLVDHSIAMDKLFVKMSL